MRVKSCSRNGCESKMVDTYVLGVGYVCYSCQEEFKLCVQRLTLPSNSDYLIRINLKNFLNSEPGTYDTSTLKIINDFFNKYTN